MWLGLRLRDDANIGEDVEDNDELIAEVETSKWDV